MAPPTVIKALADVPTIAQLYKTSSLAPPASRPLRQPSAAINASVGLICGDITKLQLDAIVNAANSSLRGGGGVDGAIHRAAGPLLLEECKGLKGCRTGQAKLTRGYNLPSKYIIHTVGPVYGKDPLESERLLRSCYEETMKLAVQSGIKTLAFSGISTGVYGYPVAAAAKVACDSVRTFLDKNSGALERVIFVTFGPQDVLAYNEMIP